MTDPAFFGFGSLVNVATHTYPAPTRATLSGWRRVWQLTDLRDVAFLSVRPDPGSEIDGLIARVPGSDWAALDQRETGYQRHDVTDTLGTDHQTCLYQVAPKHHATGEGLLLLSYLDVVVQGYLAQFGASGVARFFDTTDGWHRPVIDDRAAPIYPRAQALSVAETELVDSHITRLGLVIR